MVALFQRKAHIDSEHTAEDIAWPGWLDVKDIAKTHPRPSRAGMSEAQYGAALEPEERQWVHIQPWLQSKGYMLRPRFRAGWTPSWSHTAPSTVVGRCEDSIRHNVRTPL